MRPCHESKMSDGSEVAGRMIVTESYRFGSETWETVRHEEEQVMVS